MILQLKRLADYLTTDFLGGPRPWKLSWVINFQKAGTFVFVAALMWYYQNFSTAAFLYLALHGSYGFVWLLKDMCFPDQGWQKKVTIAGGLMAFFAVLFWYWVIAWLLIKQPETPDYPLADAIWFALCVSMCIFGCVIMTAADAQKFYTLKLQKGLIDSGIHKYIRHPNYLGEIMIYGSFGLLAWHWLVAVILCSVWLLVFVPNMVAKEKSLSRHPGWEAYKKRSGWISPFL